MSSIFSTCRNALKTAAGTVSPLDVSQIVLGDYNWAAGTDFFADIQTTGPWLFIKPTKGKANGFTFNANFIVTVHLVYGFDDNTAYDWTAPDDIIAGLVKAWVSYSEFVQGGAIGPFDVSWEIPEVKPNPTTDGQGAGYVARTVFTFVFPFVADQGA